MRINIQFPPNAQPTAAQQVAIQYAVQQWEQTIQDPITINLMVCAVDMSATRLNGMCVPRIFQNANLTLTSAQAKQLGLVPANAAIDMYVFMDTLTPWVLGIGPRVLVRSGELSLSTTMMHEICHGLGFLGLCNVDTQAVPPTGIYADTSLILLAQATIALMNPVIQLPAGYFPPGLANNILTPFDNLFQYTNPAWQKGIPADDFIAFTTVGGIEVTPGQNPPITVDTGAPFQPFTSCDHIVGNPYLMNPSTVGQYYQTPDYATIDILRSIGWTI